MATHGHLMATDCHCVPQRASTAADCHRVLPWPLVWCHGV